MKSIFALKMVVLWCCACMHAYPDGETFIVTGFNGESINNASPAALDYGTAFGNQECDAVVSKIFYVQNQSAETVRLSGYRMRGSNRFRVQFSTARIMPREKHPVEVFFEPKEGTFEQGSLYLYLNDEEPFVLQFSGSSFEVKPATGSCKGGGQVDVAGKLPDGFKLVSVRVGQKDAEFRQGRGIFSLFRRGPPPISITVPAVDKPGTVDITLFNAEQTPIVLPAVFTYE